MGGKLIITPNRRSAGFTLIELLVAVAVISVLAVGAVLSAGRGGPPGAGASDMALFQERFTLMQALAIEGRAARGLKIAPDGLQTAIHGPDGWTMKQGGPRWRGRVVYQPRGAGFAVNAPDILFLSNGRSTAFAITFTGGGRCENDGWTGLTCAGG